MPNDLPVLVIEGVTLDGKVFRPSDWIERLIDTMFSYGEDRRTRTEPYSGPDRRRRQVGFLQAQMIDGRKCLVVDMRLRDANPAAYRFLQNFIQNNCLRMMERDNTSPAAVESPE
jgi:hypothetical protein